MGVLIDRVRWRRIRPPLSLTLTLQRLSPWRTIMQSTWIRSIGIVALVAGLCLAITVCSSFAFAGDFEGVIHMKSTFAGDDTKVSESEWFIKDDHLRMERRPKTSDQADSGRMGAIIVNAEKKMRYVLIPERKLYIEHSAEETIEKTTELLKDLKYEIVRTGKTDTVAGYKCE